MSRTDLQSFPSRLRRARLGFCLLVILSTPFEKLGPIISLPGQNLTNLELVLALAIFVWGLGALLGGRIPVWKTPLSTPWIVLLVIMILSALTAPEHRQNALHFTGRCVAGFLFFLVVIDVADSTRRIVLIVAAIATAGSVVAVLGTLEFLHVPGVRDLLAPFQAGPGYAVGQTRVSSTLQYSTIASMYLEIVFALGAGLLILNLERKRWGLSGLLFLVQAMVGSCVVLTLTRGGLFSLLLALGLASLLCYREWGFDGKVASLALLAAFLSLVTVTTVCLGQEARLRLTTLDQANWYKAEYEVPSRLYLRSGELRRVEITLRNVGLAAWSPAGPNPFRLSYHWLSADGSQVVDWEGIRTQLPGPVEAREEVLVGATVHAPLLPGEYQLAWDLLQENRFWFSKESSPSALTQVEVRGEVLEDHAHPLSPLPAPRLLVGRELLWRLAGKVWLDHPWLGVGPDNFRLVYGRYADMETFDLTYHTHNTPLEFFVDTGLLGGAAFLWMVWLLIRLTWRNLKRASGELLALNLGVSAAVAVILTHGLFDYFFEFTPTYLSIFTVLALSAALSRLDRRGRSGN